MFEDLDQTQRSVAFDPGLRCLPLSSFVDPGHKWGLDTVSSRRNWTWLYILLPCLGLLIIFIIVLFLLYCWLKKRELKRARKKQALPNADHPLGEVSLQLDAPAALGMQHGYIDRKRDLLDKPPRRRMSEDREDLFGEQSLDLNLEIETWTIPKRGRPPPLTENGFSGAIVNGSVSNGSYSQKQPNGIAPGQKARASGPKSKVSSTGSGRLVSKTKNFLTARMAANNLKSRPHNPFTKSYERSTKASSGRTLLRNGVHPEPKFGSSLSLTGSRVPSRAESKAVSRPGSRALSITGSRRGSIDDLVSSRSSKMPRSKTMVLEKTKEEKRPGIYTMPEEYATEGGPNEVMPTRPPPVTGNILRDAYQTFKGKSQTNVSLKKPMATRKPWH